MRFGGHARFRAWCGSAVPVVTPETKEHNLWTGSVDPGLLSVTNLTVKTIFRTVGRETLESSGRVATSPRPDSPLQATLIAISVI